MQIQEAITHTEIFALSYDLFSALAELVEGEVSLPQSKEDLRPLLAMAMGLHCGVGHMRRDGVAPLSDFLSESGV